MNQAEAGTCWIGLTAVWPQLAAQTSDVTLDLWFRNAFRHTRTTDAQEVLDRLIATMSYAPKPADWVRVDAELRAEQRRAALLDVRALDTPPIDPDTNVEQVQRLREMLKTIGNKGALDRDQ